MVCKYGHESERNRHGKCVQCTREIAQRWRERNPEKNAQSKAAWQKANPDRVRTAAQKWNDTNAERFAAIKAAWQKANTDKVNAICAKRRAVKLQATPSWADERRITAVYREAAALRRLGIDAHVDHIYPLQGETVSGLHVHNNLRVILAKDNQTKGNRHPDA